MDAKVKLINKKAQVRDNSYSFQISKPNHCPMLALTQLERECDRPIVKVVSEPYVLDVLTINGLIRYEFITVSYKRVLYVVLNNLDFV